MVCASFIWRLLSKVKGKRCSSANLNQALGALDGWGFQIF